MTTNEVKAKKFKGGGIEFFFEEAIGGTFLAAEDPKTMGGFGIPLKKMRAAHAAMGRAIEAWEEREK